MAVKSYEKSLQNYKTVKTSLKSIVKTQGVIDKIEKAIIDINTIIFHTYHFLKLYYISSKTYPNIDADFVRAIIKTLFKKTPQGAKPKKNTLLRAKLQDFYDETYISFMPDNIPSYTNLTNVIEYEIEGIITNFENHIKLHFWNFLNKYINVFSHKYDHEQKIRNCEVLTTENKTIQIQSLRKEIKRIKDDIYENENKCIQKYNYVKKLIKSRLLKHNIELTDIDYKLQQNPLKFLPVLVNMNRDIENWKKKFDKNCLIDKFKLINCFPLRTSFKPKYIKFDTLTLLYLLFTKDKNKNNETKKEYIENLVEYRKKIWGMFFKTDKNVFKKKGYVFNNQISTDGFGCSILFVKKELYNPNGKTKIKTIKKPRTYVDTRYVTDLTKKEKTEYLKYKKVGIDPGKDDLIYATNGKIHLKGKKHIIETFRYTQNQRRFETKTKVYAKNIQKYKRKVIGNKNVIKYESDLSFYSSSSSDIETVKKYLNTKVNVLKKIKGHYNDKIYRKQRWYSFINRQRSEAKMINNFKDKFGNGKKTLILMGDFEEKNHMRYKESTKGKGFRNLFKKAGYNVFLVDEYNTSRICHVNGEEMTKFRPKNNKVTNRAQLCHGLLRSKIVPNNKPIIMNRDTNGSLNIRLKGIMSLCNKKCAGKLKRLERQFQGYFIDTPTIKDTKKLKQENSKVKKQNQKYKTKNEPKYKKNL